MSEGTKEVIVVKKIVATFLALALCVSTAGCSAGSAKKEKTNDGKADMASESAVQAGDKGGDSAYALTAPVTLRFASGGSGGSDFTDIGTIVSFLSKDGILPKGSQLTQETISGGTTSSGYLIEAGMADVCRGQNAMSAIRGMNGRPPYQNVRALFAAGGNSVCMQTLTSSFVKKSGFKSLEEIIENKYPAILCTEDVGSSDYALFSYIFEIYGITPEDYEGWGGKIIHTDNNTASEMLQDGQADLMIMCTTLTSSLLTELTMTTDVVLNGFNDKIVDGLLERGFAERYIPAGTFGQFDEDTRSAYIGTSLIVSKDMSDELAYTLTKTLMEHRDELGESCATMRNITDESAVNTDITVVPLHPGAIKYFQEVGVLDENGEPIKK